MIDIVEAGHRIERLERIVATQVDMLVVLDERINLLTERLDTVCRYTGILAPQATVVQASPGAGHDATLTSPEDSSRDRLGSHDEDDS